MSFVMTERELVAFGYIRSNYEKQVPKDIIALIKEFSRITIDSNILTQSEQEYLVKLVNEQPQTKHFKYCEWKLLCRGSTHGITQEMFHKYCDGKPNTICILDMHENGYISGGFASTPWMSTPGNVRAKDDNTYLFCVKPIDKRNVYHRSRGDNGDLLKSDSGLLYNKGDGFNFGYNTLFWGNYDTNPETVYVSNYNIADYYALDHIEEITGPLHYEETKFKDYEVFQLLQQV
eukprot:499187_1